MSIRMVPINELKTSRKVGIRDVLDVVASILHDNGINKTVVVNKENIVIGNHEVYWALRKLGVKLVPVSSREIDTYVSLEYMGFYDDISPEPYRVFMSTLELLYRNWPTPLVLLSGLSHNGLRVWAKLEGFNPFSGSIKDRIGWYMFIKAIEEGRTLESNKLIYEATSTNTGIALAAMAAIHGFKARLYIPTSIQKLSDTLLKVMGAEAVRVSKSLTVEFVDKVDADARRDQAIHLNQFENDYNFEVHLRYTAKEIDLQLRSIKARPTAIIGGIGTSGHMSAITFYFKNKFRDKIKIYCVQPAPDNIIPGIRRIESGMKWIHWVKPDRVIDIEREEAIRESINIARSEGILVGLSSGAVVAGFKRLVEEGLVDEGDYVLVFPDHGFKYVEQFNEYLSRGDSRS